MNISAPATFARGAIVVAMLALPGCIHDTPQKFVERLHQADLKEVSFADKTTSEAKGTKTCVIRQWTSAYKTRQRIEEPGGYVGSTNVVVRVYADGRAGIAVTDQTYPGTSQYFLIGGKRFSGDGDKYIFIDRAALVSLKSGEAIKYTWNDWPYNSEHNAEDAFAGFDASYQDCLSFLGSHHN